MSTLDVADMEDTKAIMAQAERMAPVGAVFHLAMLLRDKWLPDQVCCMPLLCSYS